MSNPPSTRPDGADSRDYVPQGLVGLAIQAAHSRRVIRRGGPAVRESATPLESRHRGQQPERQHGGLAQQLSRSRVLPGYAKAHVSCRPGAAVNGPRPVRPLSAACPDGRHRARLDKRAIFPDSGACTARVDSSRNPVGDQPFCTDLVAATGVTHRWPVPRRSTSATTSATSPTSPSRASTSKISRHS